ncbi:MAG: TA system VapC family ribonuclease toxin [Desulfovermiculus sp.]
MRALFDVNVLIALLDAGHSSHRKAMNWLENSSQYGWASCPITQNGCVRIMSNPKYPAPLPATVVADRLGQAVAAPEHVFWPDDISLLGSSLFDWSYVLSSRHVTDMYLLGLAVQNQGRFLTFDRRTSLQAVSQAETDHLCVLC